MGKRKRRERRPSSGKPRPAKPRGTKGDTPKAKRKKARAKRASIPCPACGGAGARSGVRGRAQCRSCGAVFPRKVPAPEEAEKERDMLFARRFSVPRAVEKAEAEKLAHEAMCGFFRIKRGRPAPLNAFGRRVLEVNCGHGLLLLAFKRYGWTVAGMDTSARAAERARRELLDVRRGRLIPARFGRTRFDLVVFHASFGVIADPHKAVEKLYDVLKPEGLVCVLREPLAGESAKPPADAARVFLHTAESLKRVFRENKFAFVSGEVGGGAGTFWFGRNHGGSR